MLSLKIRKTELQLIKFQDGRRRPFENSSACYKMGNYCTRFRCKFGIQTKKRMQSSEITKTEAYDRKFRRWTPSPCLGIEVNAVKWAVTTQI
jgi:hypothetical protein